MLKNTIWILWGMWPYASLRCYQLILDESKKFSGTNQNHDFPHILIDNIPVKELTDSVESLEETISAVQSEYEKLRIAGANIFIMACNTMHLYYDKIFDITDWISNLSLIDEMTEEITIQWYSNVGILWSLNTIQSGLYQNALMKKWVRWIILDDKYLNKRINDIIRKVIGWDTDFSFQEKSTMEKAISILVERWSTCIILGCTELPIAFAWISSPVPLFDPLCTTIRKACALYYAK